MYIPDTPWPMRDFLLCLFAFCTLSCLNSPDVIYVHDGRDKSSPVIGQLCNTNTFVELVSTNNRLYMEFVSRSHFPGQGFKGRYSFETIVPTQTTIVNSLVAQRRTLSMDASVSCDYNFSSDMAKNGSFESPNYPESYPANAACNYQFTGSGRERVQIIFTDFDLYQPSDEMLPTKE